MNNHSAYIAIGKVASSVQTWVPERESPDEMMTYIDLSAVDQERKEIVAARKMRCADAPSRARQKVEAGDVLVSTVRPNLNAVAIVPDELDGATASTGFCVLRPHRDKLWGRFLFHWVRSRGFINQMIRRATGASYPAVSDRIIHDSKIPPVALPEQRRIAEILDKADALRAKRRAAIAKVDTLTQSLFHESFTSHRSYADETLESVCEFITDGTHYTPTYSDAGVVFLSSKNVTSGRVDWDDVRFIPESLHYKLQARVSPRMHDVLLAKNGTTGIAAIVDRDCVFDIYVSLALLRPAGRVLPIYLREALNSPGTRRQFNAGLKGIGVPNLHLKEIRKTRIPVPPLKQQKEFCQHIHSIEQCMSVHETSLMKLNALFSSIQQRAFSGKL